MEELKNLDIEELSELLVDDEKLAMLKKLGITKEKAEKILQEKKIERLEKFLLGENLEISAEATVFDYDFVGNPKTQGAAEFNRQSSVKTAVRYVLKRIIEITEEQCIDIIKMAERTAKEVK